MTLKNVESLSGVSATHISQIERGMTSPTVGALQKLARALEKESVYFLEEVELEEVSVARDPVSTVILSENPAVMFRNLSHGIPGGKLHIGRLELEPGSRATGEPHHHEGEECGVVVRGTMEIRIEDRSYTLNPGDTIHFNATRPHSYSNPGEEPAEAIWVTSAPSFI
ncbi:MAG: cupin domain-containing protein [Candidatus Eisenbacteria sp.]|nr:cupin domain-containing protein [Candidatus Eisenbacteria bacterium]